MTYIAPTRLKPSVASRISIGRAARLTGLTIRAIRFYEQRGLIEGQRDARDIRTFDAADLERLAQIADLRAVGVSLDDIAALSVADALPGGGSPEALRELLRVHHDRLLARLACVDALATRAGVALSRNAPRPRRPVSSMHAALTLIAALVLTPGSALAQPRIGKTFEQSVEAPALVRAARPAAPNVLIWVIDDLGYGQLSAYGGLVETPNLDRLARRGLRYSNYHTTPICSASRAALLTGRNSHAVHIGGHSAMAIGFPGQDALVPRQAGTIADNLRAAGYVTYALGKWDHLPLEDASAAGPFTYWPSGQGFDRFNGFLSFDSDQFAPLLWSDHSPQPVPTDPAYHLTTDLADKAIAWFASRDAAAVRPPFFLYWATGAVHSPHQAPKAWLERYRGRFDQGWDVAREQILARQKALGLIPEGAVLPPRPDGMSAWDSLSADRKRSYARAMEAFAAQLSHADFEFGRMLDALEVRGELDNTLVIVISDNGASAEGAENGTFSEMYMANGRFASLAENLTFLDGWGGPASYPHYPMGWAVAGNTPFRYYKQTAYEGGTRVPLIVSWPKGIAARGEVRGQYAHVIDITPTVLRAAGVSPVARVNGLKQSPFDGASFAASFDQAGAPDARRVQYFEMYGNRALWADGWKAVMPHRLKTWNFTSQPPITDEGWELYDLRNDPTESYNLAADQPGKLKTLVALFDREARRNNVYPLTNTGAAQRARAARAEAALVARSGLWTYDGPVSRIPEALAPQIQTHDFSFEATVEVEAGADGVVMAMGGRYGGMSLYLQDGRPKFGFRSMDLKVSRIAGAPLGRGSHRIGLTLRRGDSHVAITVDGKVVAEGQLAGVLPVAMFSSTETFDLGSDEGTAPTTDYRAPFVLQGRLRQVRVVVVPR